MSSAIATESKELEKSTEKESEDNENKIDTPYLLIDVLDKSGISKTDIEKLKQNNFYTVESVAYIARKDLVTIKGLSDAKAQKIQEVAYKLLGNMKFLKATTFMEHRSQIVKLTTGSAKLDELLGGGIETGSITELFGEFRTGKTQLCHMLCVTCQFPISCNGGEGCALYIDTEGTFRPERIVQICDRYGMDSNDVLNNISIGRAYSSDHQMKLLAEATELMTSSRFALVVVDSVTALFRSDYVGRGELSIRQQQLGKFMRQLLNLCDVFGVACVITNQVVSSPDGMSFGPSIKPVGGNIIAHASTTRISLRKGAKNLRIAKIYDSPNLAENEATFGISDSGIIDDQASS